MASDDAEWIEKYTRSREIYLGDELSIMVDGFNYTAHYHNYVRARRAQRAGVTCGQPVVPDPSSQSATAAKRTQSRAASSSASVRVFYLLSHFHSDHYTGITSAWRHGTIYCSAGTAALVQYRLGVTPGMVGALDYDTCYHVSLRTGHPLHHHPYSSGDYHHGDSHDAGCQIENNAFTVLLVPANHCPAAAIFVLRSRAFGMVVHTGDFRFSGTPEAWRERAGAVQRWRPAAGDADAETIPFYEQFVQAHPALRDLAGKVDTLYMDNTFCNPVYSFAPQWVVTQHVIGTLHALLCEAARSQRAGAENEVRCAVLLGSYSIGKERMALALQEVFRPVRAELARVPIEVHPYKYQLLRRLNYFVDRFQPVCLGASAGGDGVDVTREDVDGYDADTYNAVRFRGRPVRAVEPHLHAVHLPIPVTPPGASTTPAAPASHTRFLLSLFLVPLWAVSPPSVLAASRALLKRERAQACAKPESSARDAEETHTDVPLLQIGTGVGIDFASFDRVLAVAPTGWMRKVECRHVGQRVRLLRVPYSEHSSYPELLDFVQFVNPRHLVPTVSAEQYARYEPAFLERAPRLRGRRHATLPLVRFFGPGAELAAASVRVSCAATPTTSTVASPPPPTCEPTTEAHTAPRTPIDPFREAERTASRTSARRTIVSRAPVAATQRADPVVRPLRQTTLFDARPTPTASRPCEPGASTKWSARDVVTLDDEPVTIVVDSSSSSDTADPCDVAN